MPNRIAILGSTGSIGTSALEVIEHLGADYRAIALGANRNIDRLIAQARKYGPEAVAVGTESLAGQWKERAGDLAAKVYVGSAGMVEMVGREDVDTVLAGMVGAAGVEPVLAAVKAGKRVALANKEALVVAGSLVMAEARKRKVELLPVDSEHSAVFQAMLAGRLEEVKQVILTASGGPFRSATPEQMESATVEDALKHPTWQMGSKITIDSATMFNKGLEIIEACWLFDLPPEKVKVVIHPESVIHSMVEYVDGSVIAQLSPPDMRTPIQYALTYPRRKPGIGRRLDLSRGFGWNFEPPDMERFPALRLCYEAAKNKGSAGAILNAANEVAVSAFLAGKIRFGRIWRIVELTIRGSRVVDDPDLKTLLEADRQAREMAQRLVNDE